MPGKISHRIILEVIIAKQMINNLYHNGIPADRIRPVMNRFKKRRDMVSLDEAQDAIGEFPIEKLSNDYSAAVKGINFGKPLAVSAARSSLRKEISALAKNLAVQKKIVDNKVESWLPAEA